MQCRAVLFQDTVVMLPMGMKRNIPSMMDFLLLRGKYYSDVQQHKTPKQMLDRTCSPVTSEVGARGGAGFREPARRGPLRTKLEVKWRNICVDRAACIPVCV